MYYKNMIMFLLLAASISCKKEEPERLPSYTWTVGSDSYICRHTTRLRQPTPGFGPLLYRVVFSDDTAYTNFLSLDFFEPPQAGQLYKVGYFPDSANEVRVSYSGKSGSRIASNDDAQVQHLSVEAEGATLRFIATELEVERYTFVVNGHTTISMNVVE